jgi:hypothetical protein
MAAGSQIRRVVVTIETVSMSMNTFMTTIGITFMLGVGTGFLIDYITNKITGR